MSDKTAGTPETLEKRIVMPQAEIDQLVVDWGMDDIDRALQNLELARRRLAAERDAAREATCHHGWRGTAPDGGERIVTPCPHCGAQSLFIGSGGHLTCARVPSGRSEGCGNPSVADAINALKQRAEQAERRLAAMEAETIERCARVFPESDEKRTYTGDEARFLIRSLSTAHPGMKLDGWISVKDRLPDFDQYVLWCVKEGNCFVEALDKDGDFALEYQNVTHWMPLAAAPNPDEEANG